MTAEIRPFHLSGDNDLQSVVRPLKKGIVSIYNAYKFLLDAKVDPNTGLCSSDKQLRKHIEHAEECLKKSETMIKEKLIFLDQRMELLTKENEKIKQESKEKCKIMKELKIKKDSDERSLKCSKAALEGAKELIPLSKRTIKKEKNRKNTGKGVIIAGAVVTAIPVIGLIAGTIMMVSGGITRAIASKAIRKAEDDLIIYESKVEENSEKVSNYQSKICNIQEEIEETIMVLKEIQEEIKGVKQHLEQTSKFQMKVRRAVYLLSDLSGKVTVLESKTRRSILWQPVMNVMKEVLKALRDIEDDQLLFMSQGVRALCPKSRPINLTEFLFFSLFLLLAYIFLYFYV